MTDSDPKRQRLRLLFDRASELTAAARGAFLDRECGSDAGLRRRLVAMLEAADRERVPSTLGRDRAGSSPAPSAVPPIGEGLGSRIGPYRLLEQIGEGGFGTVFLAEQEEPVMRQVALKVIKLGMDTRQVVARFEQERQALAMMDHPNIARVLDAGATDTGRPYFVMDWVKGSPIVEFCDKNELTIAERLELFAQVCGAIQHAHQKGIIHRDLKPSNVLVGMQDGRPEAKVIDFGIAKATSQRLTDKTLLTEQEQVIGTLQYMSPEQAEGSLDIDTRTDVYSLGILLYELLTGSTPFDQRTLQSAAFAEIHRLIREVEPPRPSTRLSESRDTLVSIAAHRRIEPKHLSTILRGDLDWIVMKALEKDRARRYETASGLALDVRRYLAGEAVLAAPPSASYRIRKFVRRNRVMVSAAAAVAAALLLGIIAFAWQARVASDQRDIANEARTKETEQRTVAERERRLADEQRDRAVAAEKEAEDRADELATVAEFQSSMLSQIDPARAGRDLTDDVMAKFAAALSKAEVPDDERAKLLDEFQGLWSRVNATDTALALIDRTILKPAIEAIETQFENQPVVDASLRTTLGKRYIDLGLYDAAKPLFESALETRRRVLGEEHPDTLTSIGNFGSALWRQGHLNQALPYLREQVEKRRRVSGDDDPSTLAAVSNLGILLNDQGQRDEAMPYYREVLDKSRRVLGEDHPDTLGAIADMGALLWASGKNAEAMQYYREVLEKRRRVLGEDHLDTLISISNLGVALNAEGKMSEAADCFREVLEKRRRLLGDVHPRTLDAIKNLGATLARLDRKAEGEALMREALTNQRRLLGSDHPSTLYSINNLGVFLAQQGRTTEAEPLCRESLERRRRVMGPNHPDTLIANSVMGFVLLRQERAPEAEPFVREAIAISLRVNGEDHKDTLTFIHNLGMLLRDLEKFDEAELNLRIVVERGRRSLGQAHPITMSATLNLAAILIGRKRFAEAMPLLEAAEPEFREGSNERSRASLLTDMGKARAGLGKFEEAESNLLEAHRLWVQASGDDHPDTRACIRVIVDNYAAWHQALPGLGYDAKASTWNAVLDAAK